MAEALLLQLEPWEQSGVAPSCAARVSEHTRHQVFEAALPTADPIEAYSVTHKALGSAIKVMARADDSSGIIGDACLAPSGTASKGRRRPQRCGGETHHARFNSFYSQPQIDDQGRVMVSALYGALRIQPT